MVKDERSAIGALSLGVAIALSLAMVATGLVIPSTVGEFDDLFRGFGAELPWLTSTVLSFRIPVFVILLLCLMGQVVLLILLLIQRTQSARRLFYRIAGLNFVFFLVLLAAMYLPMFKLGAPV